MTVYTIEVARDLEIHSLSRSDRVEISLKTNNKKVLDYWDMKIRELLSDEHYLDYLKEEVGE